MTTNNGNTKSMTSEINVTPMIDVLLVLLIIFMVIVPAIPKGENAETPLPPQSNQIHTESNAVVLEMLKSSGGDLSFSINQQPVAQKDLPSRLASIYANRAERILFLKGDDRLSFTEVADVIDISHAAGIDHVGLMTPRVLAGQ